MQHGYLRIPDDSAYEGHVNLHYLDAGSGETMIFIHGLGADHVEFEHQVEHFALTHRCIAFDQRGFGLTDAAEGELSVERSVLDLEALVEFLGLDRFILVGHSMGTMVSYAYTLRHPERVKKLVIIGGTAGIRESSITYAGLQTLPRFARYLMETHRRWLIKKLALNVSMFSLLASPRIVQHYLGDNPRMFNGSFYETCIRYVRNITDFDYRSQLGEIQCPVLLLHGGFDLSISVTAALNARKVLPNSKLRVLPLCGHSPNVEMPDSINRAMEKFLRTSN